MASRPYTLILAETPTGYSAHAPDVPGCVATGTTFDETVNEMRAALAFHLEGMVLAGLPIPERNTYALVIEVDVPADVGA